VFRLPRGRPRPRLRPRPSCDVTSNLEAILCVLLVESGVSESMAIAIACVIASSCKVGLFFAPLCGRARAWALACIDSVVMSGPSSTFMGRPRKVSPINVVTIYFTGGNAAIDPLRTKPNIRKRTSCSYGRSSLPPFNSAARHPSLRFSSPFTPLLFTLHSSPFTPPPFTPPPFTPAIHSAALHSRPSLRRPSPLNLPLFTLQSAPPPLHSPPPPPSLRRLTPPPLTPRSLAMISMTSEYLD
jgi:hypothetical protein